MNWITKIRRKLCKHIMVELDFWSDNRNTPEQGRGLWYGQGDQKWAWFCVYCGACVEPVSYLEACDIHKAAGFKKGDDMIRRTR